MQICATIMRLVVILSVLVQIYANTGSAPWTRHGLLVAGPNPATTVGRSIGPVVGQERVSGPAEDKRPERNIYRTKLSKLRLILLADMLNEIPPPPLELITCLANSSSLNVTTKHCDCEAYSCKDLLASSSPSPLNYIQPKRKIHTSCRDHCCRKKKFNRSIDPAALENVVTSSLGASPRRYNTVPSSSTVHRSPMGSLSLAASSPTGKGTQPSVMPAFRLRTTTGLPSPASVRDHRDRSAAPAPAESAAGETARVCASDGIDQISIANNRVRTVPWLYRVGLIETKHPVCVGALIHPSLILTTAVCVINKKPEELVVWSGPERPVDADERDERPVGRIMLPEQFATTFERLENNVALLLLVHRPPPSSDRPIGRSSPPGGGGGGLRAWPVSVRVVDSGADRSLARTVELFPGQRKRTPTSICLSSIIDRTPDTPESSCYAVSFRKTNLSHARTGAAAPQPTATGSSSSSSSTDTGANNLLPNDGTNYVTTNISIFPATECRPEHREYLQHGGNLCAGYGAAKNRSIDVDFSGSPLICDQLQADGKIRRTVQGLLTWSTDINHAPHLFTNLTTYRPWIDREIEKLDSETRSQTRFQPDPHPTVRSVVYG
ncbi:uncharacterized protein LOC118508188 [Anopheles stephensi]|uniref:uncharacterized protein LOC118508188 n=1 Tax=Anopheles stephensi TaxID=30069 RepID=UPI0016589876|nr:uncharacterized protein LOC118508188 [Anopheles stephensi]XP_035903643.1 uncharacterized protein LOC118508188 [Anopheles stephensi]